MINSDSGVVSDDDLGGGLISGVVLNWEFHCTGCPELHRKHDKKNLKFLSCTGFFMFLVKETR